MIQKSVYSHKNIEKTYIFLNCNLLFHEKEKIVEWLLYF